MAEYKQITSISVVTDTEYNQEQVGDIEGGGIDKDWLKKHIEKYGPEGLFKVAAYINFQTFEALREINSEKDSDSINKS